MKRELKIVIILLLIALGVLFGWYLGTTVNSDKESTNDKKEIEKNLNEEKKEEIDKEVEYQDWMQYILNADIKSMSLFKSSALEDSDESIDITIDDLKAIFVELMSDNESISRFYSDGIGFTGGYILTVEYVKNDVTYTFEIRNGFIFCYDEEHNEDKELYNLLNTADYKIVDNTSEGADTSSDEYLYLYEDISVFDEYFCEVDNICDN